MCPPPPAPHHEAPRSSRTLGGRARLRFHPQSDDLHEKLGIRREDVFINLVEVMKENWSFGNGEMQYA
jgi:hypothetical protein